MMKKECYKCEVTKPATEFHKASNRKDGLQGWCKQCRSEYDKLERVKHDVTVESKVCADCGKDKPADEYIKSSRTKSGLHSYCKECFNEYQRQYYHENKTG